MTIERRDDEILSLLAELVFTKQHNKLFPDPSDQDRLLNLPENKKATGTPNSQLSSVKEGESDQESHTVYPKIEIEGDTVALESQCTNNDYGGMTFISGSEVYNKSD